MGILSILNETIALSDKQLPIWVAYAGSPTLQVQIRPLSLKQVRFIMAVTEPKKDLATIPKRQAQEIEKYRQRFIDWVIVDWKGSDAYYSDEATMLVKKAAKWQEAGADTLAVEEWLYDQLGQLSDQAWEKQETTAGQTMDSLQAQSRTLVDEFTSTTMESIDNLEAVGLKVTDLDGSEFTVYAALDGSAMESTVDSLIAKFQQLATVAANAGNGGGSGYQSYEAPSNKSTTGMFTAAEMQGGSTYTGNRTINVNVNQKQSRSDLVNLVSNLERSAARQ